MKIQGEAKFEDMPENAKLAITAFDLSMSGDQSAAIFYCMECDGLRQLLNGKCVGCGLPGEPSKPPE